MKATGKLGIIVAVGLIAGCTTVVDKTQAGLGDAAMAPLTDLNLRRTEVPALLEAIKSPYEPISVVSCQTIGAAVAKLTEILGPDADAPAGPDASLADQAGSGAADLTLNTVSSPMTDFIPFRSVVREATGASAHARRLRVAYERGHHAAAEHRIPRQGSARLTFWRARPTTTHLLTPRLKAAFADRVAHRRHHRLEEIDVMPGK